MRRRAFPPSGRLFLGKRYESEAEYRRARDAHATRRRRLLALVQRDDSDGEGRR